MASTSFFASTESQKRWRLHMKYQYTTQNQDIRACVFQVPDNLRETKPEAYIPQILGLGPYHHFRPQVQHVSSKKRDAVYHTLDDVESGYKGETAVQNYEYIISSIEKSSNQLHSKIRSCYDRFLDLDEQTLSWIVVVDSIVLWHCIVTSLEGEKSMVPNGTLFEDDKIAPDIFMLENQIPAFLIAETRKVLRLTFNYASDSELSSKFYYFCKNHSPLKLASEPDVKQAAFQINNHILHFMYQLIMRNEGIEPAPEISNGHPRVYPSSPYIGPWSWVRASAAAVWEFLCIAGVRVQTLRDLFPRRRGALRLSVIAFWSMVHEISNRFKALANVAADHAAEVYYHVVDEFTSAVEKAETAGIKVSGNVNKVSQLLQKLERTFQLQQYYNKLQVFPGDKIEIPSVSRLVVILNVKFKPLPDDHGIKNIKLSKTKDGKAFEFCLPVIEMRPNSEVIIRNLVAYEATMSSDQLPEGSTRLREFVDLMCGLIKSEKDVQLLNDAGILKIDSKLQNQQIVNMCSGISKSHEKPGDDSKVYSTVKDANDHFNNTRFVKFWRAFMKAVSIMVKIFRALFPFFIVLFLCFQSACEIFDCRVGPNRMAAANLYSDGPQAKALILPRKLLPY